MQKPSRLTLSVISSAIIACSTQASAFQFNESFETQATVTKPSHSLTTGSTGEEKKTVTVMKVKLTPEQRKHFTTFPTQPRTLTTTTITSKYPSYIDLGMNNVPVLDQGRHGSCVTFAVTAAIDALLYKSDYISQLCSLELGQTIKNNSYTYSGWDGSWAPIVAQQLVNFGVISKQNQLSKSCAGVTVYPLKDKNNTGSPMPLDEYYRLSEDISKNIAFYNVLSEFERMQWSTTNTKDAEQLLDKVKSILTTRYSNDDQVRVVFGTLLPVNHCSTGACGTYKKKYDSWVLTDAIRYDSNIEFGGHQMIITGYDDNAVSYDNTGKAHKGLLIVRNSWGNDVGNNGTYYISYDFFKQFVGDVDAIVTTHVPIE